MLFTRPCPEGAASLDLAFDVVDAPPAIGEEPPRDTANLAIVQWSSYLVYPQGAKADTLPVSPVVIAPAGWDFATALPVRTRAAVRRLRSSRSA